ncbi:MAG: cbb3-type cytochrome c oxidase subunit I [Verrucomicrobia bacterium]|nr:cbb3-type cytochrome c oxidase subunit I [Verrucomicrobiota bacterium]MDE3100434.1 cbb3-type cytochrome c oxidase subunit I [Verrucomicrobiota bacterium]
MNKSSKNSMLISKGWIQAVALVMLFGFFVLGLLAHMTYTDEPPIPAKVVGPDGNVLFTGKDISAGQEIFLKNGLMEYGSIFGHGAYLGPDYTADYLHRAAEIAIAYYGGTTSDAARQQTIADFKTNRFDAATGVLTYSAAQVEAFEKLTNYYAGFFGTPTTKFGLRPDAITNPNQIHELTAFFSWSAWAASALRPHKNYSYTNNWPPESLVGNHVTADAVLWSVLSLTALLGGIGLIMASFGRWKFLGWHGREEQRIQFRPPDQVMLTPAQRACAWFFLVMALLFTIQTLLGGAVEHYRADLSNFFGLDLARVLPFNIARTWHIQLAIFWVSTSYLAAGIFLVPMITGREPRGQSWLSYSLLGALAIVVFGSLAGEYGGIEGWIQKNWSWFGDQGFEYLDLGRFWQILLTVGLLFWVVILFRGLRNRLRTEHMGNMPWLFFFAALAIPAFYAVGLLAKPGQNFTTTDFWRFWVVHLWVEDFLELFTTVMVAYVFVLLGVVHERVALRLIYLDVVLYSAGGVIGTMHHVYFSGEPAVHMALGAFFSAAEVIPLTLLTLESWSFLQLGAQQGSEARTPFPHFWAVMFLAAVGFWNFLGAGIFGFLINLPVVSYYEIGTALTPNHGHAAMMGVYGMLSVGLALFCLRYLIPEKLWSDRAAKVSFWSLNLGLAWMVFASLFPVGLIQLYHSVDYGYFNARSLKFLSNHTVSLLEWMRLPGDVLFIVGGTLPVLYLCWLGVARMKTHTPREEPDGVLFTEIQEVKKFGA